MLPVLLRSLRAVSEVPRTQAAGIIVHLRTPLYRNGYLLMISAGGASLIGVLYWVLAAHYYSPRVVGLNSAAISAVLLLSGAAQLSMTGALARFVPVAGRAASRLVLGTYTATGLAGLLVTIVFSVGIKLWSPSLEFLVVHPLQLAFFVTSVLSCTVFAMQDSVLAGLRRTSWVPLENIAFALIKLVLLVVLASKLPTTGIYVAWMIPVLLSLFPINWLLFRRFIPAHETEGREFEVPSLLAATMRYVAANYLGTIAFLASSALLPIIVTDRLGAEANAHFYAAWLIGGGLQLVVMNLSTSLLVEGSRDRGHLDIYCYRVFIQSLRILVPASVLFCIASRYILLVFGSKYAASGTILLDTVALASIPNVLISIYISSARVRNRVTELVAVQGVPTLLFLALANALLSPFNITGVGVAYLVVQVVTAGVTLAASLGPTLARGRTLAVNRAEARRAARDPARSA